MPLSGTSKHKPRIEWRDSYSVGIEYLDSQHRKLLELINKIGDAAGTGLSKASCFAVLNAMIRYAQEHFTTEERYLEKNSYPKYLEQKGAHEKFVQETFTMAQELDEEGLLTLGGITIYLRTGTRITSLALTRTTGPSLRNNRLNPTVFPQLPRPKRMRRKNACAEPIF